MDGLISSRYANALFKQAEEQNIIEEVKNDIQFLTSLCNDSEEFNFLLNIPSISSDKKAKIIESALGKAVQKLTLDFIKLVVNHRRESLMSSMCESYIRKYQTKHGIKEVLLTTAIPMDDDICAKIRNAVETSMNVKAEMKTKVNPDIIGGFILNIDNHLQMDASVASQLEKIKKGILGNSL
jgi:ATP synthase, F1 delta subunit